MKRFFAGVVVVVLAFSIFSAPVVAQDRSADEIIDTAERQGYPDSLKDTYENSLLEDVCNSVIGNLFNLFFCKGTRVEYTKAPNDVKTEYTEEDVQNLEAAIHFLESGDVAGTESARVLAARSDSLETYQKIAYTYYPNQLKIDKCKEGGFFVDSAGACTKELEQALLPAGVKTHELVQNPDPVNPDPVNPDPVNPEPVNPDPGSLFPANPFSSARQLVASIKDSCTYFNTPGRVTSHNVQCLRDVKPSLLPRALDEMRNSSNAFENLQCVGFVRGVVQQFHGHDIVGGGNAIDFSTNVPRSYRYIRKTTTISPNSTVKVSPEVGDLLLWDVGNWGHIAYISHVYDRDNVEIIEANWGRPGLVQWRNIYVRGPGVIGWVSKQ
jgi:surface antigen